MDINEQLSLWDMLAEDIEPQEVEVKGALNVHSKGKIAPFDVHLTTGDLTLIVAMIEDYIRGLDVIKANDIQWQVYYRGRFQSISNKIQEQIEYDYEKALKKCLKKQEKEDDIGDEAMSLMIKKARREAEAKQRKDLEEVEDKNGREQKS